MKPSTALVLRLLRERFPEPISAIEIDRQWGVYRAGARVHELRKAGWQIETARKVGETAEYRLLALEPFTGTLGLVG